MAQEKTEAIVLRGVDFSESSRIVTFLTPRRGRLACIAKGARRKNSPLGPVLDTFNRVDMVYYEKQSRQVQNLGEVSLIDSFPAMKQDLERASYATFPLELAYKVAHENEPSEALYETLVGGLTGLAAWPGDARTHVCWNALHLLCAAGFEPELEQCVVCEAPASGAVRFAPEGGVTCCGGAGTAALSADAHRALRAMRQSEGKCPTGVDRRYAGEVFGHLRRYAEYHLETGFRSVRVLDQMFGD